jgi:hypothetical protein
MATVRTASWIQAKGRLVRRPAAVSTLRAARRAVVALVGFSVLALGVALIVLPGPAFIVIPIGLGDSRDGVSLGSQAAAHDRRTLAPAEELCPAEAWQSVTACRPR